jgi:electron transfer flavoprotein alpha subunit
MTTLLLGEVANGRLSDLTARALTAALQLGAPVDILVAGRNVAEAAARAANLSGVARVRVADDPLYEHGLAEPLAALIVELARDYTAILAASSPYSKNVLPRAAALLDVMQVSDITKVLGPKTFERPIYAGNAIQTVEATDTKIVATVRTASFAATGEGGSAPIEPVAAAGDPGVSTFAGEALAKSDRPELTSAKIIISGGRAMQRPRISRLISSRSPTSWGPRWAPRAPRSTPATLPTTGRSGRPARWWRPISISRSAYRGRSSIWRA